MPRGTSQSTLTKLEVLSVDFATSGSLNNTDSKLRSGFTTAMSRLLFYVTLSAGDVFHYSGLHRICNINKLTSLPMCGFIAQLVEQRGGHGFKSRWSPDFFQASFQLLKLENLLRWSFFTLIYNRSSKMNYFIYFTSISTGLTRSLMRNCLRRQTVWICLSKLRTADFDSLVMS